ncbi:hypothetical protein NPIL_328591 [Nephila pilipes]|uniref:Uncharacterized protein n=1 Tax=Nephila pilipes TaxID=299642 RepID=A0A8X6U1X7_NEPPI|nr:hypothetical protein NPIL_328591 [Nephila pilipes]
MRCDISIFQLPELPLQLSEDEAKQTVMLLHPAPKRGEGVRRICRSVLKDHQYLTCIPNIRKCHPIHSRLPFAAAVATAPLRKNIPRNKSAAIFTLPSIENRLEACSKVTRNWRGGSHASATC